MPQARATGFADTVSLIPLSQRPHDAIHHARSTNEATAQKLGDLAKGTGLANGSVRAGLSLT